MSLFIAGRFFMDGFWDRFDCVMGFWHVRCDAREMVLIPLHPLHALKHTFPCPYLKVTIFYVIKMGELKAPQVD